MPIASTASAERTTTRAIGIPRLGGAGSGAGDASGSAGRGSGAGGELDWMMRVKSLGPSATGAWACGRGADGVTKTCVAPLPGTTGVDEGAGIWKRRVYSPGGGAAGAAGAAGAGERASSKGLDPSDDWKYAVNSPGLLAGGGGGGGAGAAGVEAGVWNIAVKPPGCAGAGDCWGGSPTGGDAWNMRVNSPGSCAAGGGAGTGAAG